MHALRHVIPTDMRGRVQQAMRRARTFACSRITRTMVLLAVAAWSAPHVVGATGRPSIASGAERWPMRVTRAVHNARLRTLGATITRVPPERLQHEPNDCALAVVTELQRTTARPSPDRAWLARSLALDLSGVALDPLAVTLRELGWNARVTRGESAPRPQPLHPPAIALMRPGHYVLLIARTPTRVEYFDPLVGLVQQPLPAFKTRWTGNGVQLSARDN